MKFRITTWVLLLLTGMYMSAFSQQKTDPALLGKWQVIKKTTKEMKDSIPYKTDDKPILEGGKILDFTQQGTVIILEYGEKPEEKKVYTENGMLYMGKHNKHHVFSYKITGTTLVMFKQESKTKKKHLYTKSKELVLQRRK